MRRLSAIALYFAVLLIRCCLCADFSCHEFPPTSPVCHSGRIFSFDSSCDTTHFPSAVNSERHLRQSLGLAYTVGMHPDFRKDERIPFQIC